MHTNPSATRRRRAVVSAVLWVALAACAGPRAVGPGPGVPAGASEDWARAFLAEGGQTFVPDPVRPLVWLGVVSQELPYDGAVWYCRRLPPHGPTDWRVPTVAELRGAPFARFALPEEAVRLWTSDVAPGELYRRWVVDPRTGARELKEVRQGVRLRVLCVTDAAP